MANDKCFTVARPCGNFTRFLSAEIFQFEKEHFLPKSNPKI